MDAGIRTSGFGVVQKAFDHEAISPTPITHHLNVQCLSPHDELGKTSMSSIKILAIQNQKPNYASS